MNELLGLLAADESAQLLALGRPRRFPAHSIVLFEADPAHDVIIVQSGDLKVFTTLGGREVVLDVVGAGAVLGELAIVDGAVRSAMVMALTDVEAVVIAGDRFREFLDARPLVLHKLLCSVTARLRETSRRQVEYGALDAVGRVCGRLVELMDRYGTVDPDGGTEITAPLTQADIAAWAGLSREAVVRALHDLRRLGWVRTASRSIVVTDVPAVRGRALAPG